MPDMTLCTNKKCPKRLECYRYCAIPDHYQSYFEPDPDSKDCEYFEKLMKGDRLNKELL